MRRRPASSQGGVAAIEFALIASVIVAIVPMLVLIGRMFWYYEVLQKATFDAARYLSNVPLVEMMNSTSAPVDSAFAQNMVVSAASAGRIDPLPSLGTVTVYCDGHNCGGGPVKPGVVRVFVTVYVPDDVLSAFTYGTLESNGYLLVTADTSLPYAN